ncbi:MAG TPA: zf-TFIIB domain-containing protein [Kofleriaceae bacterium]|jgi:Zn-finger nucleic acid-binding protein|nr:zf-TFIIB domain-containing protein [Kofleriaceae bacterium]
MILACLVCDSRYDVSGHAIGQKFRCRCGTMMTLTAPSPAAGELSCPHCGAGVSPREHTCAHCAAELLLKACPRCLSRVFHGHKHCPECGADLTIAAIGDTAADRPCPRCTHALHARRVGDLVIDECGACLGVFLDHVAIKRVIVDRAQARAEALLGALPRSEVQAVPAAGQKMYLPCPVCHVVMNRRLFATGTGVIIDVCRTHGTFFDAGELPLIIEFVMNGGLEKAQKRDIERMHEAAQRELAHARDAANAAARMPHSTSSHSLSGPLASSALVDFLATLFH